jgi:hypothetical protein
MLPNRGTVRAVAKWDLGNPCKDYQGSRCRGRDLNGVPPNTS